MSPESQLQVDVRKLYVDMYYGQGDNNPPMTLRVARLEEYVSNTKADESKAELKSNIILGAVLTTLGAIIVDLFIKR